MALDGVAVDQRSGFCKSNSVFYSKRRPVPVPYDAHLEVTTFISSRPHSGHLPPSTPLRPARLLEEPCGVHTTTNPQNTPGEIAKQVADPKPRLAFTTSAPLSKLSGGAAASLPIVILDDGEDETPADPRAITCITEMMKSNPTAGTTADVQGRGNPVAGETISQDDTATLLYSSGTTGINSCVHPPEPDLDGADHTEPI